MTEVTMANVLKTFIAGEKITADDTNDNNRYLENLNTATAQELQAYLEQEIERLESSISGSLYLPGDIKITPHTGTQAGFLLCDGSSLLREDYPELFAAIGTVYGAADDYHFNVPDFQGAFLRGYGGNSATIGTKQGSAVPDIWGNFGGLDGGGASPWADGVFRITSTWAANGREFKGSTHANFGFRLSWQSSVYQNVTEARPDNYAVNFWIKY